MGVLQRPYMSLFMTLGVGHIIAKYQKYMFVIGENVSVWKNWASARHSMQQVSSEIDNDTRKMHIILRYTGCPSLALVLFFIFFLYQFQGRPLEHLFVHQHAKTVKRFVVQAYKKRVYLAQHMKRRNTPQSHCHHIDINKVTFHTRTQMCRTVLYNQRVFQLFGCQKWLKLQQWFSK